MRTLPMAIGGDCEPKLAEHFSPNRSPIGKRIRVGTPEMQTPWLTVVAEVTDVKLNSPDEPTKEPVLRS